MINKIFQYLKSRKYVLLFSVVYFLFRTTFLNSYFLLKDERDLILTAISLAQTGKDLYNHSFPLVFSRISPQAPLLGMYWTVPFLSLFHITTPIFVKVIYLLPTLFFPLFVFELVLTITKEKKTSFLTSFVVSLSPWYFHIGRLGVEAHLAYSLCLLGSICYMRKKKILGLIFLLLSYFSYYGLRPFILVLIPYFELWHYFFTKEGREKKWKNTFIYIAIFIVLFSCIYALTSRIEQKTARSINEVVLLNKEKLTLETNFLREISSAPFFVRKFFDNKPSIVLHTLFYNFFKGIDLSYLFFTGDYVAIYSNQIMGQFFPFLFIFLILGIYYLAKKKRQDYYFIAGFSFVGLVSSLINSYSLTFSIRSVFSLIGIGFICSLGIIYAYEFCNKTWKLIFATSIICLYLLFSIIFLYRYLFQNYKTMNSLFNEQERYVANYIRDNKVRTIIVPNIHSYFLSYLVTLPSLPKKLFPNVGNELSKPDGYIIDGHHFFQCNEGQIVYLTQNDFPSSTLIDGSCISVLSRSFINLHKTDKILELLSPEYKYNDINREVKYYLFK